MTLFQTMLQAMNKLLGKSVDYDKAYGNQCVDYVRWYANEIGHPINTFSGSAYNGWTKMNPFKGTKWVRKVYTPGKIATRGAIIFFAPTPKNEYGHVAIVQNADSKTVTVSEQNAGSGNGNGIGSNAINFRTYSYKSAPVGNVLGWYEIP